MWKATAIFSTTLLAAVLAAILGYSYFARSHSGLRFVDTPSMITQVKQLKQLVTVRYSIQRVVGMTEPKVPLGSESILLMVQGEALAGVDLGNLSARDFKRSSNHIVTIALPAPQLLDAYLDEKQIKVWDHSITWWTPWVPYDPDLEHKARLQALNEVRSAALEMGILDQAQRNAEESIRDFLGALHIEARFEKRGS